MSIVECYQLGVFVWFCSRFICDWSHFIELTGQTIQLSLLLFSFDSKWEYFRVIFGLWLICTMRRPFGLRMVEWIDFMHAFVRLKSIIIKLIIFSIILIAADQGNCSSKTVWKWWIQDAKSALSMKIQSNFIFPHSPIQQVEQNIQTKEKHPRRDPSVWLDETCCGHVGLWKFTKCRCTARWWRSEWMGGCQ